MSPIFALMFRGHIGMKTPSLVVSYHKQCSLCMHACNVAATRGHRFLPLLFLENPVTSVADVQRACRRGCPSACTQHLVCISKNSSIQTETLNCSKDQFWAATCGAASDRCGWCSFEYWQHADLSKASANVCASSQGGGFQPGAVNAQQVM